MSLGPPATKYVTSGHNRKGFGEDPAKCKAAQKRFYKKHPDARRRYALKYLYGLTPAQLSALEVSQSGRCAICGQSYGRRYHIDHSHQTGKVRGLLCYRCNWALGAFERQGPDTLRKALEYAQER